MKFDQFYKDKRLRPEGTRRLVSTALFMVFGLGLLVSATPGISSYAAVQTPLNGGDMPDSISKPQLVNMYFRDPTEPSHWAEMGFDLPEAAEPSDVHGYLRYVPNVRVTPDLYQKGRTAGIYMRVVGDIPDDPEWDPACYRNYDQMLVYLNSVVSRFPALAEVTDIGDSWCKVNPGGCPPPHAQGGYDIWRIKLTNSNIPGPKPKFHLVAAHHAREIATPELAMQWIEELVTGYGVNADATWLLDHREVYVVPVQNPDGWYHAYTDDAYWRKNDDNRAGACAYPNTGVDPNRNYDIAWSLPGASSNPCSQTFYGYGPNSEPETQAMVAEYLSVRPHSMITLHTFGPYVLYPWGYYPYNQSAPVDRPAYDAIAWNMGRMTNTPRTRVCNDCLYQVSGATDDWTYNELGIPSFTWELGGYGDFNMPCSVLPNVVNLYKPALTYTLKATGTMTETFFMRGFGPTPQNVTASVTGNTLNVSAVISANYGTTSGAVYSINVSPEDGNGAPMTMSGQNATAQVDVSSLPAGRHMLFVQGKTAFSYFGNPEQWGVVSAVFFTTTAQVTQTPTSIPPTDTPAPPTNTVLPPTNTVVPPTFTQVPPTSTATAAPPTTTAEPTACAISFSDVGQDSPFYAQVRCLACRGIVSGYGDGTFLPNNNVTRGQAAKIVSNAAGYDEEIPPDRQTFEDVPPGHPFWLWIERMALPRHGVIIFSGYECGGPGEPCGPGRRGYFRPYNNMTRGQLSKGVARAARLNAPVAGQTFEDVPPTDPFYMDIERLAALGVMGGYDCGGPGEPCVTGRAYFRPYNHVTRGQSSKIVANTFFPNCQTP